METSIVPVFNPRQKIFPTPGVLASETTQILFEAAIDHFGLAVRLRVIGRTHLNSVPCSLKNSRRKELRKMGSLSLTIDRGIPCSFMTPETNISAIVLDEYG
jgi:hypothetical protein